MKYILGRKIKMSQIFKEDGKVVPVTLIEAGPCAVTQIKLLETDGYDAVQIGFEPKTKGLKKTDGNKPYRVLREWRGETEMKVGDEINISIFEEGDKVKVTGVSKGKGYQGGVKRHGFVDKAKAHGAKDMRRLGSTGARFPQRTIKGRRMPGRMGTDTASFKNLEVIKIDEEKGVIAIKGAVPGHRGTLLEITG